MDNLCTLICHGGRRRKCFQHMQGTEDALCTYIDQRTKLSSFQHHLSIIQCHASNYKPPKPLSPRMPCINFPELNRKIIITMQKIKKIKLKNAFSQCNSMQIHASIIFKCKTPHAKISSQLSVPQSERHTSCNIIIILVLCITKDPQRARNKLVRASGDHSAVLQQTVPARNSSATRAVR